MGTVAIILVIFIYWAVKAGKRASENAQTRNPGAAQQPYTMVPPRQSSAPIERVPAQKRVQMRDSNQWTEAKRRQDDARQVHSIRMDSCEHRLESLRVLYDAGILDREEYAQRVARVKARHNER